MSVPPDRMAATRIKDPNKIMGLPKWAFWAIMAAGLVLAYYIYKRSQNASAASDQTAADAANPLTDQGLTAADVGGIPQDNSLGTVTDEEALEQQIQTMQQALSQLEQTNGGNGAGVGTTTTGTTTGGGTQAGGTLPLSSYITPINPAGSTVHPITLDPIVRPSTIVAGPPGGLIHAE